MTDIRLDPPEPSTAAKLFATYEWRAAQAWPGSDSDWRRDHLGASIIGHECDRYLWLSFRWAVDPKHSGQQLRLFERGKREEEWIIEDLRAAGIAVKNKAPTYEAQRGDQFGVKFSAFFAGSVDGIAINVPEAPKTEHVLEVKTHNAKSFSWLTKNGLKRGKPQHYAQVQVYMRGMKLDRALYVAVCKDNDDIYTERVHLDAKFADQMIERGLRLTTTCDAPPRLDKNNPPCMLTSKDGTQWPCQFYELCHGKKMPERSCRTCVSCGVSGDVMDCEHLNEARDSDEQRSGCKDYVPHPGMVNAQVVSVDEDARKVTFQFADGTTAEN